MILNPFFPHGLFRSHVVDYHDYHDLNIDCVEYVADQYVDVHSDFAVPVSVVMTLFLGDYHLDNTVCAVYVHHCIIFQAVLPFCVVCVGCVVHNVVCISIMHWFKSVHFPVMVLVAIVGKSPFVVMVTVNAAQHLYVHTVWVMWVFHAKIHYVMFHMILACIFGASDYALGHGDIVHVNMTIVDAVDFSLHVETVRAYIHHMHMFLVPFEVAVFEGDILEVHHMKMHVGEVDILENNMLDKLGVHVHVLEGLVEDVVSLYDHWRMSSWHHNCLGKGKREIILVCLPL